ncbi:MAG: multiheme c-type cytochrome [Myxococcales bacterium]|nr:multiheme c-type cytochrome [Myxococcales bacterium]
MRIALYIVAWGVVAQTWGCGPSEGSREPAATRDELMVPANCGSCHARHYREWASSMHAYAAEDPVFLAMNARGQRETDGELGDFCVNCHAPLAVRAGLTRDGLDLEGVPKHMQGVTCYFCHSVAAVTDTHNNALELADDSTLRGGVTDPAPNGFHTARYSELHDGDQRESAKMCGACHDVITPSGVHLERTFVEWKHSSVSRPGALNTCITCHMNGYNGEAAPGTGRERRLHEHLWPGVDAALTEFPDREIQEKAILCALSAAVRLQLCIDPGRQAEVTLETHVGHGWPTGTTHDRRAWLEIQAHDANGQVIFRVGDIQDDELVDKPEDHPRHDPRLLVLRDRIFDGDGDEVHMFWEAAKSDQFPEGYRSGALPVAGDLAVPHTVSRQFRLPQATHRVTARVHIRPLGLDLVDDLIASGDLDPGIRTKVPTFTLTGSDVEWNEGDGYDCVSNPKSNPLRCPNDYRCLLDGGAPGCGE